MADATVSVQQLSEFCTRALRQLGADENDAQVTSDALVMTDTWGVFTHGTKLLHDYLLRIQAGGTRVDCKPELEREGPAWAVVEGHSVMGQVAGKFAMDTALAKARKCGVAYVGVKHTNHFGAAGYYASIAAQNGMIGLSMANDIPSVVAPGARTAVTGSNPLSYAVPTGNGNEPIMLDMAISSVAGGKVYAACQRGEPIPDTWIVGPDGLPTTDGQLYPAQAALQPAGGAKGYGLALLVETLSGVLSGASITWQIGNWIWGDKEQPTNHGAAFLAVDVNAVMPAEEFYQRVDHLVSEIHNTPTVAGVDRVMLPGEREWRHRQKSLEHGLHLPEDVLAKLRGVAEMVGEKPDWL